MILVHLAVSMARTTHGNAAKAAAVSAHESADHNPDLTKLYSAKHRKFSILLSEPRHFVMSKHFTWSA